MEPYIICPYCENECVEEEMGILSRSHTEEGPVCLDCIDRYDARKQEYIDGAITEFEEAWDEHGVYV